MAICQHQGKGYLVGVNLRCACCVRNLCLFVAVHARRAAPSSSGDHRKQPREFSCTYKRVVVVWEQYCAPCLIRYVWGKGKTGCCGRSWWEKPLNFRFLSVAMSQLTLSWNPPPRRRESTECSCQQSLCLTAPSFLGMVLKFPSFSDQRMRALCICNCCCSSIFQVCTP